MKPRLTNCVKGDRRLITRKELNALYLPLYDALCAQLPEEWQPYSGKRSFEQQDTLYAQGRTAPGDKVTNAKGGQSAHCYGCGTDWTIFDENDKPVWMKVEDPRWKIYEAACNKVGLKWGGHFSNPDCFHNEVHLSCSWGDVGKVFEAQGLDAALQKIAESKI